MVKAVHFRTVHKNRIETAEMGWSNFSQSEVKNCGCVLYSHDNNCIFDRLTFFLFWENFSFSSTQLSWEKGYTDYKMCLWQVVRFPAQKNNYRV